MMIRSLLAAIAFMAGAAIVQFAEASAPATTTAATAAAMPTVTLAAAKKAPKKEPIATKVNLNTADAKELDKLPQIGPARAKAIVDARGKSPFKDWDDFVARKVVPANAQRAIKDLVIF